MALYLVTPPVASSGKTSVGTKKGFIVSAADSDGALLTAAARFGGDGSWADGVATALTETTVNTTGGLVGWRFHIDIFTPAGVLLESVSHVGVTTTSDVLDEIGTALATALNATDSIANASHNTTTQTLTVATGSGGDDLGDHTVQVRIYAPAVNDSGGQRQNQDVNLAGEFYTAITHEGLSTAALSIAFVADTVVIPQVLAVL